MKHSTSANACRNSDLGEKRALSGAIALAVNGMPIFNALNNRGDDAYLAGELDDWGGHAGRADDYHYHMPNRDGWEVTRLVRADPFLLSTPIIMLTARVEDTDKIIGLE